MYLQWARPTKLTSSGRSIFWCCSSNSHHSYKRLTLSFGKREVVKESSLTSTPLGIRSCRSPASTVHASAPSSSSTTPLWRWCMRTIQEICWRGTKKLSIIRLLLWKRVENHRIRSHDCSARWQIQERSNCWTLIAHMLNIGRGWPFRCRHSNNNNKTLKL